MHKYGESKMTQIMMLTTSCHCVSETYEISGHLIFVEQNVPTSGIISSLLVFLKKGHRQSLTLF